jgi:hypothetical protein
LPLSWSSTLKRKSIPHHTSPVSTYSMTS